MNRTKRTLGYAMTLVLAGITSVASEERDVYKVQRESKFEFAAKPTVEHKGDQVTISFETKSFCDVTVAIEDARGRIVRHLASGILGKNAPAPFKKDAKRQSIVWDGKNDLGKYVGQTHGDLTGFVLRVSLGLRARFERSLYWDPRKRVGLYRNPWICTQPEGVYVYEGSGVEMIRLFGHDGKYIRTVYPFSSEKVKKAKGVEWKKGLDGFKYPQKQGYWRSTFLLNGRKGHFSSHHRWGSSCIAMAVANGRIATWAERLDRLATDGTSGGLDIAGPKVHLKHGKAKLPFRPHCAAFSPDAKKLYFTAFYANFRPLGGAIHIPNNVWKHGVYRMDYEKNDPPKLWKGEDDKPGNDNDHFNQPAWVECDAKGRVYIADYFNDRIQVFEPDGKFFKTIKVEGPSQIQIHHKTQEIYAFSWLQPKPRRQEKTVKPMLRKFGPVEDPKLRAEYPLKMGRHPTTDRYWLYVEDDYRAALDSWAEPPTIWFVTCHGKGMGPRRSKLGNVSVFEEKDGKLVKKIDFDEEVKKTIVRTTPPLYQRQRLYVDPRKGTLYLGEAKDISPLVKIDPNTGKCSIQRLPFGTEDMAFDLNGFAYLRAFVQEQDVVGRFEVDSWREVPYDYGEVREKEYFNNHGPKLNSALIIPSKKPVYWHQSGMAVTPKGELFAHCYNRSEKEGERVVADDEPKDYKPKLYPGRYPYGCAHVFDRHGKMKNEDAVPGLPDGHGAKIDQNGDLYVLVACHPLLNGKDAYHPNAGTIIKFKPGKSRIVSSKNSKIPLKRKPKGKPQLVGNVTTGQAWAEGAEWMYGGIGIARPSAPCQCFNTRFELDLFGRSFAPETDRSQVAVLDTNGNLILRVGRYANVDEGTPLVPNPRIPKPRPLGGDEVGFIYPVYVGTHTDRRLFVSDPGNGRIVSVKLDYHTEEKIDLKKAEK